jgi:hypothetical protein
MLPTKFDVVPNFFLKSQSSFEVEDFGYKYAKAAVLGKSTQNTKQCEAAYNCPLTQAEFSRLISS